MSGQQKHIQSTINIYNTCNILIVSFVCFLSRTPWNVESVF